MIDLSQTYFGMPENKKPIDAGASRSDVLNPVNDSYKSEGGIATYHADGLEFVQSLLDSGAHERLFCVVAAVRKVCL